MSFNLQFSKSENIKAMFSAPKWLTVIYGQIIHCVQRTPILKQH